MNHEVTYHTSDAGIDYEVHKWVEHSPSESSAHAILAAYSDKMSQGHLMPFGIMSILFGIKTYPLIGLHGSWVVYVDNDGKYQGCALYFVKRIIAEVALNSVEQKAKDHKDG